MAKRESHRPILGISGLVLFVCMFVPAVKGCGNEPIVPLELPPVIPPYMLGLGFAIAAFGNSDLGLKGATIYLRVVTILFLTECVVAVGYAAEFGLIVIWAPIVILVALGLTKYSAHRVAAAAIATGVASSIWFGLFCADKDALIGVWMSLISSIGLVLGGIVWLVNLRVSTEPDLPTATVISSGE